MIGDYYWTTGIGIYEQYPGGENKWIAKIHFEDYSHAQLGGSQGSLSTKYADSLLASIQTVKQDAENLGIKFVTVNERLHLYVYKLVVESAETWQQIQAIAEKIEFEVVSCVRGI